MKAAAVYFSGREDIFCKLFWHMRFVFPAVGSAAVEQTFLKRFG